MDREKLFEAIGYLSDDTVANAEKHLKKPEIILESDNYRTVSAVNTVRMRFMPAFAALILVIIGSASGVFFLSRQNRDIPPPVTTTDTSENDSSITSMRSDAGIAVTESETSAPVTSGTTSGNSEKTSAITDTNTSKSQSRTSATSVSVTQSPTKTTARTASRTTTKTTTKTSATGTVSGTTAPSKTSVSPTNTTGTSKPKVTTTSATPSKTTATTATTIDISKQYPTPQGFHDNDYQKLVKFALQGDNRNKLKEEGWDLSDPNTWVAHSMNSRDNGGVEWSNDFPKRVTTVWFGLSLGNGTTIPEGLGLEGELDLSGFTELISVNISNNEITKLNLSDCPKLLSLNCASNHLKELDLSNSPALFDLKAGFNSLTKLNVSRNTKLHTLYVESNMLTSLNVSACTELTFLLCNHNQLTKLDMSANTKLIDLMCHNNRLTELNVQNNFKLMRMGAAYNRLTEIKDFTCLINYTDLWYVDITGNYFDTSFDSFTTLIDKLTESMKIGQIPGQTPHAQLHYNPQNKDGVKNGDVPFVQRKENWYGDAQAPSGTKLEMFLVTSQEELDKIGNWVGCDQFNTIPDSFFAEKALVIISGGIAGQKTSNLSLNRSNYTLSVQIDIGEPTPHEWMNTWLILLEVDKYDVDGVTTVVRPERAG